MSATNPCGSCFVACGGVSTASSCCATIVTLIVIGYIAIVCATTTTSWTPQGNATMWNICKWSSVALASSVGVMIIGCCCGGGETLTGCMGNEDPFQRLLG